MQDKHILIVEDEVPIRQMIRFGLQRAHFLVSEAGNMSEAHKAVAQARPDLILLDWMLPAGSGLNFMRALREESSTHDIPIIMVTARVEQEDRVRGLELGCDDYITKPFSPAELVARINAVLRRTTPGGGQKQLHFNNLHINVASQRVSSSNNPISLGPLEYKLLLFLASYPEQVFSRAQLLDRVWGHNVYVEERTVDTHVRRLRKALAPFDHDQLIQTVRGTGYRFSTRHD